MKSSCARIASESLARAARPSHLRSRTGAFPPVVRTRSVIATTSTPTTTTTTGSCSSRSRTCQTASFSTVRTLLAKQEYEPATTWEGLEWIGTPEWKSERRALQREPGPEVYVFIFLFPFSLYLILLRWEGQFSRPGHQKRARTLILS